MHKRNAANVRVKNSIRNALLSLMKEKHFSDITVSEIVKKAHVARVSYYRNFNSKEAVLYDYAYEIHEEYTRKVNFTLNKESYPFSILTSFKYFYIHREFILELFNHGLLYMFLELLDSFVEEVAGDMPASSIEKYKIYIYTGAVCNMTIKWLKEGAKETPEEMAKAFMMFFD